MEGLPKCSIMCMSFSIPINKVQKLYFSTSLLISVFFLFIIHTWKVISPLDLISVSLILSDFEHFSYAYWSFLWRNVIEGFYRCESWTIKKAEQWRIDAFELWCWRRLLRVPWTARRSNQSWMFIGRTDVEAETPKL